MGNSSVAWEGRDGHSRRLVLRLLHWGTEDRNAKTKVALKATQGPLRMVPVQLEVNTHRAE